jgi:hypothetical protein
MEVQEKQPAIACADSPDCFQIDYSVPFSRSMVVDGRLVLISAVGLKVVALDSLTEQGSVSFFS